MSTHSRPQPRFVIQEEFEAYTQKDRRHERILIFVGAIFDLMVVLLALDRWLL